MSEEGLSKQGMKIHIAKPMDMTIEELNKLNIS